MSNAGRVFTHPCTVLIRHVTLSSIFCESMNGVVPFLADNDFILECCAGTLAAPSSSLGGFCPFAAP